MRSLVEGLVERKRRISNFEEEEGLQRPFLARPFLAFLVVFFFAVFFREAFFAMGKHPRNWKSLR